MLSLDVTALVILALWLLALYLFRQRKTILIGSPMGLMVQQIGRDSMADKLTYQVTVGAPQVSDVVSRNMTIVVDGANEGEKQFPGNALDLGRIDVIQGSKVVLTLVDVDDAGNRSQPATCEFVAADTLAPPVPGSFGVTLVAETVVPDAPVVAPAVPAAPEAPKTEG